MPGDAPSQMRAALTWRSEHDRDIVRLAVPAFGALIAEPLYVLADTAVVGRIGTTELAGMAVAASVLLTFYAVCVFLAYGTTATVARRLGEGDRRAAAGEAVQSLWMAAGIGVGAGVVGWVFATPLLRLLGAEGAVLDNALIYLRVSTFGLPAMLLVLAGTGWLRGVQDTRTPLVVAFGTAAGNLLIECVLVFGLGYGIGASALSTVLVQWVAAVVYVRRIGRDARAIGTELRPHGASLRSLALVGRDLVIRTAALRAALVIATAVAARIGTVELAAHQIVYEIWTALALSLDAVAIAGQSMTGHSLGAGLPDRARAVGDRMIVWGAGLGLIALVVVGALSGVLPHLFTADPEVQAVAAFLLLWVAVLQPVNGVVFALDGILIGAGDQRYLAVGMVISLLAYLPLALLIVPLGLGIAWLWGAIGVLMVARLITLALRWRTSAWQR